MLPEVRIEVEKTSDGQYRSRVTDKANGQVVCTNDFAYDPDLLVHIEPQTILEKGVPRHKFEAIRGEGAGKGVEGAEAEDPIVALGQRLFGYLIGDRAAWDGFLQFNSGLRQGPARLNLALDPQAAVLWSVPWEYLHDGSGFLALQGRWQIGRLPWALAEVKPGPAPLPLRILVVIASPADQAELNVEREIEIIQEALDEAQGRGVVKVEFLDFATLEDLREALTGETYHVVHFTGHGSWNPETEESALAFETEDGQETDPVTPERLCPLLVGNGLRLAVLSSCLGARTGARDAFIGMGTALLKHADLPAVLAMQSSILDESGIALARAFYTALGRKVPLEEALLQVRLALWDRPGGPGTDWGLPALYLRTHELRLIDPEARVEAGAPLRRNVGGLPLPRGFVGRKEELRRVRRAVLDGDHRRPFVYVWGLGGVGKTALAAKALAKLDPRLDGWTVVDCRRERMPLADVLSALANFLRGRGRRQTELAETLLDSRLSLTQRVDWLAQNTEHDRFLFVFDNLETALEPVPGAAEGAGRGAAELHRFADDQWREFFTAVFRQNWHFTWLFTSRYRLDLLADVPQTSLLDEHLDGLSRRQAVMFMGNLPRLAREPLADKLAAFDRVGGHPKTIELLEGWLAPAGDGKGRLRALLDDPATAGRLAGEWDAYFLGDLLGRLSDEERRALEALSVFDEAIWWRMVAWMTAEGKPETGAAEELPAREAKQAEATRLLPRWDDLSLVQLERVDKEGDAWYALHAVVREYVWGCLDAAEQERLQLRAAAWYREQILAPLREKLKDRLTPDSENAAAAQVLQQLAAQTENMDRARWAVATGLSWRAHLFAAGQWDEGDNVVNALTEVLHRWGQRDLAKALLRGSIETLEGYGKAVAQANLAALLAEEGRLDEALATYEAVLPIHKELGGMRQMATILAQISIVYRRKGEHERAIERQEASLEIDRELGDEEGQAIGLHQLSILHMLKQDYDRALETSRRAEAIDRKRGAEAGLGADLHQQGLILNQMGKAKQALRRFQEALEIARRIGDEPGAADSLGEIGKVLLRAGKMPEAIAAFTDSLEVSRRLNNPAKMGIALECLGGVHEGQGEYAAALEKYGQAKSLFRQYSPPSVARIEGHLARVKEKIAKPP